MRSSASRVGGPLVTCEAVITESCYLLRNLWGASEAMIENVAAGLPRFLFSFHEKPLELGKYCENTGTEELILRMPV